MSAEVSPSASMAKHFDDLVSSNLTLAKETAGLAKSTSKYFRGLLICAALTVTAQIITFTYLVGLTYRVDRVERHVFK